MPRPAREKILFLLPLVIAAGFGFKLYEGPGSGWANSYGAGVVYEIFWIYLIFFFMPETRWAARISLTVFALTCALEFLQLWHPRILEDVRSTFAGRTLIGSTFSWADFPHYAAGCLIGYVSLKMIAKKSFNDSERVLS